MAITETTMEYSHFIRPKKNGLLAILLGEKMHLTEEASNLEIATILFTLIILRTKRIAPFKNRVLNYAFNYQKQN